MFFQIIETSSAGNCAFFECDGINILIDVGIGVKKIDSYLAERSLSRDDIDAIFVTHEHSDHCRSLKYFVNGRTKVFANRLTCESIIHIEPKTRDVKWTLFENGVPFSFGDIEVCAFSVPHDTSDSVGYKLSFNE